MKKSTKIILAIFGGVNSVMFIFSPTIIAVLWVNVFQLKAVSSYFMYFIGFLSTLFRAIKVGGFIDDEELLGRIIRSREYG